ncbi:hypothetical protein MBLNU459_g7046t2 [Dothideomycetes sp. NU459]
MTRSGDDSDIYVAVFASANSRTQRHATPLPKPTRTTTYGLAYKQAKSLLPSIKTTTWGSWLPGQTAVTANDTADPYGMAAWQQLWVDADLQNFTFNGIYSTTVKPTPVPTSSLVLPPKNYFGPSDCYALPKDFVYGGAAAAAQIEGAIGQEGRTPSILERWSTNNSDVRDYITNENYYLYKADIAKLAAGGMKYYHFTISWNRIVPFGVAGSPVNKQGLDHYDDLINTVLDYGMIPIVSIMHFDTPFNFIAGEVDVNPVQNKQSLFNYNGGFQNETWSDAFVYYGKIVLAHYSDRVPIWISNNSPFLWCYNPLGCHNVIKTHAELYHFYHDELKGTGKFGMKIGVSFPLPLNPLNASDVAASERFMDLYVGILAYPLYLGQQYPASYAATIPNVTLFTDAELKRVGHTADFFALNEYTSQTVTQPAGGIAACQGNVSHPNWPYCVVRTEVASTGWALGYKGNDADWNTPVFAIRECLKYLWNKYKLPMMITEFGFVVPYEAEVGLKAKLFDSPRSEYYLAYLSEMLKSMYEDGVEVIGALAWSWIDNWEFGSVDEAYGLIYNNFTSQERMYKKSFFDFVDFFKTRIQS